MTSEPVAGLRMRASTPYLLLLLLVGVVSSTTITYCITDFCSSSVEDSRMIAGQHSSATDRACASVSHLRGGGSLSSSMMSSVAFLFGPRPPDRLAANKCPSKEKQNTCNRRIRDQKLRLPFWLSWLFRPGSRQTENFPEPAAAVMLQGFDWDLLSTRNEVSAECWQCRKSLA